ncbi:MAG: SprT-like domain-containing protein [Ginsengibacter sp.]
MGKSNSPLENLRNYLPDDSFELVLPYIIDHKVHLTITRARTTILGNYIGKYKDRNHRISINGNLNKFFFLITLLHEIAHLLAFEKFGTRIKAHGTEWKKEYGHVLASFVIKKIFPPDIEEELRRTLKNPAASSCAEKELLRILKRYDIGKGHLLLLEQLKEDDLFKIKSGRVFQKGNKVRTRFLCKEVATKKMFLFSPVSEVVLVD